MTSSRLTDLQSILLSAASRRDIGSLIPVPTIVDSKKAAVDKSLGHLLKRGLAAEMSEAPAGSEWRTDGDLLMGLILTEQGRAAIGAISTGQETPADDSASPPAAELAGRRTRH